MPVRFTAYFIVSLILFFITNNVVAATTPTEKAWVTTSNANTALLLEAEATFSPEGASSTGLENYDGQVIDLGPDLEARYIAALEKVRAEFDRRLTREKDSNVRQDLEILIGYIDDEITGIRLEQKYNLPWIDVPKTVFVGFLQLLDEQVPAQRRAKALERLQRYTGLAPNTVPVTELAKARFLERRNVSELRGPVKPQVEQSLANIPTYITGIRDLFSKFHIEGSEPALAALETQFLSYADWQRKEVLPLAREDFLLPPELYAFRLKRVGIDIDPKILIQNAQVGFMETRAAMQALAPIVAKAKGIDAKDYRQVIAAMKRETIPNESLESHYKGINTALETAIRTEQVVDVPNRPMIMRLASAAETAAQPAPHVRAPNLIGNTGEQSQFILPISNPSASKKDNKTEQYDDFNYPAVAWTLSAHEGRPGHELQFSSIIERGISQARILYAFNSVNVEGWALYAEAEMVPSEPVEGQLIALQFRLLRAARAMLDPMLNLGLIDRESAGRVLSEQVMLSPPMVRQELDRYTFNMPGQAGSYFYGYSRLLQLRAQTELALGDKFDRLAFNNFLLSQGLLPPNLLAKAVNEEFVPAQKKSIKEKELKKKH